MADLSCVWGGDLVLSATGDLLVADVPAVTTQRVLRRLLTNAGDEIWQPGYGAGLAQRVGQPAAAPAIAALVRAQILLEAAVAPQPEPVVAVQVQPDGTVGLRLTYTDAATGQAQWLTFSVNG